MPRFEVVSEYTPSGDQPEAIEALASGLEKGVGCWASPARARPSPWPRSSRRSSGPPWCWPTTRPWPPSCVPSSRSSFPNNAVEYFVSYYDYYQPEAYIPHTDTFIEKDSAINEEIDRLRLSATASLMERRDVIVVSSVSCIYGLGEPEDFAKMMVSLRVGATMERDELLKKLVAIRYERNDIAFDRNMFRVRGTRWRSGPPTGRTPPSGWSFSGTRSTASARSTWSPAPPSAG